MEPWEWLGEPLAVDFANTVRRRGMVYEEKLAEPADLREWARRQGGQVPVPGAAAGAARLDEVRAVRDDCLAVLRAVARGEPPPPAAVRRLNRRALRHPVVPQLGAPPQVVGDPAPLDELIARVVAATLERAEEPGPLGLCDAPSCGQLFIRDRDNQRWCGPACGTRARVARHAHRHGRGA